MPAKWRDLLSNSKDYPDDFTVTLKNGDVMTLGDMRSYDKEHEGELTARLTAQEKDLSTRERNVQGASMALAQRIKQYADVVGLTVDDFVEGKPVTKKQVAAEQGLDENDPLVGQLVKEIKAVRSELDGLKGGIKDIREKAIGPVINTYLEDYYESKWDKLSTKLPKGAKLELKEVMDYANKEGLKDAKGRLNLEKAIRDLTYDARVSEEAESRVAGLRKKDDEERLLASIPKPNVGPRTPVAKQFKNEKGRTKSFDEVMNDAMSDGDLWEQVAKA